MRKSPVYSADTLWVKNFVEIALSRTVSEINAFSQKSKMAAKNGRVNDFREKSPVDTAHTLWVKNFVEIALSCRQKQICVFHFFAKIQNGRHF